MYNAVDNYREFKTFTKQYISSKILKILIITCTVEQLNTCH